MNNIYNLTNYVQEIERDYYSPNISKITTIEMMCMVRVFTPKLQKN